MLQKRREAKQRGFINGIAIGIVGAIVVLIALAFIWQVATNKGVDNACHNTDPQYGCELYHP